MQKSNFFNITKKSINDKVKKEKPEDIEKKNFEDFYGEVSIINSILSTNNNSKSESSKLASAPIKNNINLDKYVDFVNEYKDLISGIYARRLEYNINSELRRSIFKNHIIVESFYGDSLNDLLEIKYWLSRVKKISGGWLSVWDDNAKDSGKKLADLLDKYLNSMNKSKLNLSEPVALEKNFSDIKPEFQNEMPAYISNLKKHLSGLLKSLPADELLQEDAPSSGAIFNVARDFSDFFLDLLGDKEIPLHEANLWKTIRKNKSKLEIITKDKSNNILDLLIWQKAADDILTKLQDSDMDDLSSVLLTKIDGFVKKQKEIEFKKGTYGSNPVKDEKKFKKLFIKCCTATEKDALKLSETETLYEKSKWIRKSLFPLIINYFEALMHLNSFIRCAYFNRIGKKSKLYEQLKNNIDILSLSSVTPTIKSLSDILKNPSRLKIFKEATYWLQRLLEIEPHFTSSWDNTVYFHVKCLNKIAKTVCQMIVDNAEYLGNIGESKLVQSIGESELMKSIGKLLSAGDNEQIYTSKSSSTNAEEDNFGYSKSESKNTEEE